MSEKKGLKIFSAIISGSASILFGSFLIYICFLKQFFFIPLSVFFIFEGVFIFLALKSKEEYKALKLLGIFQVISVIIVMTYLLVMILWNNPENMDYFSTNIAIAIYTIIKLITTLINHIPLSKDYSPLHHAYRNNDLISAIYALTLLELVIIVFFDDGDRAIYLYVIEVLTNAILTVIAAFLALSSAIRANAKEHLTPKGKIKHFAGWFKDNEVSMYFSLTFTIYLSVLAAINMQNNKFYIFLFIFYLVMAFLRIIAFIWHKRIVKRNEGCERNINHYSAKIIIFNAFMILLNGNAFAIAALILVLEQMNGTTNFLLFIFLLLPFAILRLLNAINDLKTAKRTNNLYIKGLGYLSLISAIFTLLAMSSLSISYFPETLKALSAYFLFALIQLYLFIMLLIMFIAGFKGLITNRVDRKFLREKRRQEKEALKNKELEEKINGD